MTAFASQIFNLVASGVAASTILDGLTKVAPKISPVVSKLLTAGVAADMILPKLISKKEEIPPSLFRSDFGDYLSQIKANSAKDYNRLIKAIVNTGTTGAAVKSIFSKYKIPETFIKPDGTEPRGETIDVTPRAPVTPAPPQQRAMAPIAQVPMQPPVQEPIPKQRQLQTTMPMAETRQPIALPPPEGLTPQQMNILARSAQAGQTMPTGATIALPQQLPPPSPAPVVAAPAAMPPREAALQPVAPPTALLASETIKAKPQLGQFLVKAIKQGIGKKPILDAIKRSFGPVSAEFERETGIPMEKAVDELIANKESIQEPSRAKKVRLETTPTQKKLEEAGLKPKLKVKAKPSMLEQLTQAPSISTPQTTENVDKQAFLMQLKELKKLLGG